MAFPTAHHALYGRLKERLNVLRAGVTLAGWKGKDWQPDHSLAMSAVFDRTRFPEAELDYAQAVAFLRREVLTLPAGVSRGYVTVMFGGHPLGFVKNLGNRANNLYPQEWRIRSGYVPETPSTMPIL